MIRRIVVPLDGSAFGDFALPYALSMAARLGASIELAYVHVFKVPVPETEGLTPYRFENVVHWDEQHERDLLHDEVSSLEERARELTERYGVPCSARVARGSVVPGLGDVIEDDRADLVVMATHGRTGLSRTWVGSVADELIHRLNVPLLLVRPPEDHAVPQECRDIQHILVPLDGSSFSAEILPMANRLANVYGARVTLLKVVPRTVGGGAHIDGVRESYLEMRETEALTHLSDLADAYEWQYERPRLSVVADKRPERMILHASANWGVDMIAMATHGRSGVGRLVLGSVADRVLRETDRPLLLYRPGSR